MLHYTPEKQGFQAVTHFEVYSALKLRMRGNLLRRLIYAIKKWCLTFNLLTLNQPKEFFKPILASHVREGFVYELSALGRWQTAKTWRADGSQM
jgi:hypothetical protein